MELPHLARVVAVAATCILAASCAGSHGTRAGATRPTTAQSTTPNSLDLPYIGIASDVICAADAQTIRIAEQTYSTLNGAFATMQQLVDQQFLRTASTYYPRIIVGVPAGGYTLVAVTQRCENLRLPVVGPG
ncbi:MAG: hypothetical protein JWL83_86 [Actinomycetia bacterium]|nr:hypothetical protein [Actinomycetes bacterium]